MRDPRPSVRCMAAVATHTRMAHWIVFLCSAAANVAAAFSASALRSRWYVPARRERRQKRKSNIVRSPREEAGSTAKVARKKICHGEQHERARVLGCVCCKLVNLDLWHVLMLAGGSSPRRGEPKDSTGRNCVVCLNVDGVKMRGPFE